MKIVTVIGARPQFIKEAVFQKELRKNNIEEVLVHTGQHYDKSMSEDIFKNLNIESPRYFLNIHSSSGNESTANMMIELEKVFEKENPDYIACFGDTNSTLAAALVASKMKMKLIHIEAGLRQLPKDMPEEINRQITDRLSTFLFTPSMLGVENLKKENITSGVYFTGDIMYDLFLDRKKDFTDGYYKSLDLEKNSYAILTMHRDFNVDNKEKLENILKSLSKISEEIEIVFPIHPRTKARVEEFSLEKYLKNINLIEPINYLDLMSLTKDCKFAITDSGGYQKKHIFLVKELLF